MTLLVANISFGEGNDVSIQELISRVTPRWCPHDRKVADLGPGIGIPVQICPEYGQAVTTHRNEIVQILLAVTLMLGGEKQ